MTNNIQVLQINSNLSESNLKYKHLLVDTNFLIDAIKYPHIFSELIEKLKITPCHLISIEPVLYEFTQGSKSLEEYKKRLTFYKDIIDTTLPVEKTVVENVTNLSKMLLRRSMHLSYVDCLLLASVIKYNHRVYLLSKDRSDINVSLFPVVINLITDTGENNCVFSIYDYNEERYIEKLKELLNI